MQTATSETESKSRDLSIRVHHYTLRAPRPKGQGNPIADRAEIFIRFTRKWARACHATKN